MEYPYLLTEAQVRRIEPYFPLSHGIPRVDDRLIVSAIIFVIKNGVRWRDAPRSYGPHKTIYNRFIRWSRLSLPSFPGLTDEQVFEVADALIAAGNEQ